MHLIFSCCINAEVVHLFYYGLKVLLLVCCEGRIWPCHRKQVEVKGLLCGKFPPSNFVWTPESGLRPPDLHSQLLSPLNHLISPGIGFLFIGVPIANSENCSGKEYADEFSVIEHLFFLTHQKYNWHYKNIYLNNLVVI